MGTARRITLLMSGLVLSSLTCWGSIVFSNTNPITLDTSPAVANLYPSQITLPGLSGTVSSVEVTLIGWTDSGANPHPADLDFLLAGPGGQTFEFLGGVGGTAAFSGVNLVLSDSAGTALSTGLITAGTFKPTNLGAACTNFQTPAPASSNCAAPNGSSTFANVFDGIDPNGTWSLYEFDSATGDTPSSITGGWSLTLDGVELIPTPEPSALFTLPAALLAFLGLRRYRSSNRE